MGDVAALMEQINAKNTAPSAQTGKKVVLKRPNPIRQSRFNIGQFQLSACFPQTQQSLNALFGNHVRALLIGN